MTPFTTKLLSLALLTSSFIAPGYCMESSQELCAQKESIQKLTELVKVSISTHESLPNFLLHGSSQTQLVETAKMIAKEADLECYTLSVLDLYNAGLKSAGATLAELFKKVTQSSKKCMIILENADQLATYDQFALYSGLSFNQELRKISTDFLAHTGTPNSQYLIAFTTSSSELLGQPILSRISYKLNIDDKK